ncbi:MAG: M10 family metallopeptidase C-terminal domain-containing protein [Pseudomonadota bacterium]
MAPSTSVSGPLPRLAAVDVAERLTVDFWEGFIGVPGPFAFDLGPERDLTVNLTALRDDGLFLARAALDAWSDVSGISFIETSDPEAEIEFTDTEAGGFGGPDLIRGDYIESSIVNISQDLIADFGTEVGSVSFFYYLHEVGHALGLGHPGPYNASATFGSDATFANDSWQMTVMSYFGQDTNPNIDASYAVPITPMMADVVAIHSLYGTGSGIRTGDTFYGGSNSGGGVNMFSASADPVTKTIVDTGGIDRIDLSADDSGVWLDLRPGSFSDVLGLVGNLAIAPGSTIEHAQTGAGDDEVRGNNAFNEISTGAGDDSIHGGDGDDILHGDAGDDTLEGGAGSDWLDGGAGTDTAFLKRKINDYDIVFNPSETQIFSSSGADTLVSVETVQFGSGAWFAPGGTLDVQAFGGVASLSASELTTFAEMYIAYFNRAPDAAGLFYWGTRLAEGMSLPEIAASFFVQPESQSAFPSANDAASLVDSAYENLLERAPDAAGRAYWINQLETGAVSREGFMLDLINGAKANPDATEDVRTVTDKADIGLSFAVISGLNDLEEARAVMEAYDREDAARSLARAQDLIEDAADSAGFTMTLAGVIDDPFNVA